MNTVRMVFFWLLSLLAPTVFAQVTCSIGAANPMIISFSPNMLVMSSQPALGAPLTTWVNVGSAYTYSCSSASIYWTARAHMERIAAGQTYAEGGYTYPVFSTGIPGVGVVIKANAKPLTTNMQRIDGNNANTNLGTSISARLVVTGPLSEGSFSNLPIASTAIESITQPNVYVAQVNYVINSFQLKLSTPTCSVSTTGVSVAMGTVWSSTFASGVGSTSSEVPFNLSVLCDSGMKNAKIYVTLTDQTSPANRSDRLALTPDSTAVGVGVQVLKSGTVLLYGPDSSTLGNTNQWFAGDSVMGNSMSIPLTARYIRTGSSVTPGSANARATFTMSYQ